MKAEPETAPPMVDFNKEIVVGATMGLKPTGGCAVGCGQMVKIVNQLLCAENLLAVGEAFAAAQKLGVPPELVVRACSGGAGASWQLTNLGPKIARGDDNPGFKVAHMSKDLNLLRDALGHDAEKMICFPLVAQAFAMLKNARFQMAERGTQALVLNLNEIREVISCMTG
jgi:3-hydroxyisobutyrate dehydrogenase